MTLFSFSCFACRFFNYGKSPNRGVKQFGIEVDHKVVYMGRLQRHDERCGLFCFVNVCESLLT